MLKWVFERVDGTAARRSKRRSATSRRRGARRQRPGQCLATISPSCCVDVDGWLAELPLIAEYYDKFGSHLPSELREELQGLKKRLEAAKG